MINNQSAHEAAIDSQNVDRAYPSKEFGPAQGDFWFLISTVVLLGATGLLALLVVFLVNDLGFGPPADNTTDGPASFEENGQKLYSILTPAPLTTPTPKSVLTLTATAVPSLTPTPCVDDARFVADVTLPDGAEVAAGSRMDKTWRLRNTGTCRWREGYRFKFVSGDQLGLVDSIAVVFTDPGETTDVAIPMFAPKSAGEYSSVWQMVNSQGVGFGQPVVMKIVVGVNPTPVPAVQATRTAPAALTDAEPAIRFWADDESIRAGEKTRLHVETENVAAVWLDGEIVVGGRQILEISPCVSTTYTLDVQLRTGEHVYQNVAVEVIGACSTGGYPDLTIDFAVAPSRLFAGQPAVISYTVMNLGNETAHGFDIEFRPGLFVSEPMKFLDGLELAPGYALQATYSYTWPVSGVHQALIRVDGANSVNESDEDNNTTAHVVVVEAQSP